MARKQGIAPEIPKRLTKRKNSDIIYMRFTYIWRLKMQGRHGMGRGTFGRGRQLFEGFILLLLYEKPCHGYELAKQLTDLGLHLPGVGAMGNIYRILTFFEENGLIHSAWKTEDIGPAKKEYEITDRGKEVLVMISKDLDRMGSQIELFQKRLRTKQLL
jgi:DNA-binding PadR family transcriptional regulator